MKTALLVLALLLLAGCSYRGVYDSMQARERNACIERPPSEIEPCMQAASKTYDQYQDERQQANRARH